MPEYLAPLADMQFVLDELVDLEGIGQLPGYEDATPDVVREILNEASKVATGVLSPLNRVGDSQGSQWHEQGVTTPAGWKEAYRQFAESGWTSLSCDTAHGGQQMPHLVSALVEEMWNSANMAFALCPLLTRSAVDSIDLSASDTLKQRFLSRLVSGEWTGTMVLTEPQAGSDLGAVRTRAVKSNDGSYRLDGQKIFITYGEHDLTDNIIHMVLARTPDAPAGVKGISMFLVPKVWVNEDGTLGARNDVHCVSIEHKLGIHASPTCVLAFGAATGAIGYLVGEEGRGLEYMFIMMNAARFSIGVQGIGIAERAYQQARAYARERVQGRTSNARGQTPASIVGHADVRRMLMLMKCQIEAMRALACVVAAAMDRAHMEPDVEQRKRHQAFVDLMIPVVKGWCTENAIEIASLGIQIHGGVGYVEETGAAQHFRDARITTIYEGTTGIQANDLVARKLARGGYETLKRVIAEMKAADSDLLESDALLRPARRPYQLAVSSLEVAANHLASCQATRPSDAAAGAAPFLRLLGITAGGWQMMRAAAASIRRADAAGKRDDFLQSKIATARFYADHLLSQVPGLAHAVMQGADAAAAVVDDQL
jgi:acyl-CoA dehydrogenase